MARALLCPAGLLQLLRLSALAPLSGHRLQLRSESPRGSGAASTSEERRTRHACVLLPPTVCTGPAPPEAASKTSRKEAAASREAASSQHPPLPPPQELKPRINGPKPQPWLREQRGVPKELSMTAQDPILQIQLQRNTENAATSPAQPGPLTSEQPRQPPRQPLPPCPARKTGPAPRLSGPRQAAAL